MVTKDQSIIMQVAAKIASELTPKTNDVNANIVSFTEAYEMVCDIILTSQGFSAQFTDIPTHNEEQLFNQAFPTAQPTPMNTPASPPANTGGFQVRIKGKQHGPIPAWLHDACAVKGVTEVWDNRDGLTANAKRPWFKSTSGNDAFWEPRGK
ncbi:hypothetical protein UFOVP587_40 [uncultured Caudovirales phage]|uniref:Uncharacterized protein n=1 Tax=uncultured Caudovirales phage TaxID=2100421 RepID=A0A6J5N0R0_9CAUD|nr:hypothetical protein UFOVP587_40 [uncultured Caudovirales phage]